MNRRQDSASTASCGRKYSIALAVPLILIGPSCATARLDPERNQALTFDTLPASDAGLQTEGPNTQGPKQSPSQPGTSAVENVSVKTDADAKGEPLTCTVDPPDPKPSHTRDWLVYTFVYKEGSTKVDSVKTEHIPKPRDTSRVMGRYAVELWIGCELVDRVRFAFPLQAAEPASTSSTRRPLHEPPSFTAHAELRTTVRVPLDPRATRAELVDRGTGQRTALSWPPNPPEQAPPKPAGKSHDPSSGAPATGSQAQP